MMTKRGRALCSWIVFFLSGSAQVFADNYAHLERVASDEMLLGNSNAFAPVSAYDVIVASIEQVDDQGATNGNPPKVTLSVSEVLWGNVQPGKLQARWLPPPYDFVTFGDFTDPRFKKWEAEPLPGPKAGLKMILIGYKGKKYFFTRDKYVENTEAFLVSARCRYEYSDEKRAWALAAIKKGSEYRQKLKTFSEMGFDSVEEYECGLGPNGPVFGKWHVQFDGVLETVPPLINWHWLHSDLAESGTLRIDEAGNITAGRGTGKFNWETNELTWNGRRYVPLPQEARYEK